MVAELFLITGLVDKIIIILKVITRMVTKKEAQW